MSNALSCVSAVCPQSPGPFKVRVGLVHSSLLPLVWDRASLPKWPSGSGSLCHKIAVVAPAARHPLAYFIIFSNLGLRTRLAPHCDAQGVALMIFATTKAISISFLRLKWC